jgi:hypothetical protein
MKKDATLQRAKPCFDSEVTAILARLRRSWIVGSDETGLGADGLRAIADKTSCVLSTLLDHRNTFGYPPPRRR